MTTRERIAARARSLIGIPFGHQGWSRVFIDCIGVVVVVGLEEGIPEAPAWLADQEFKGYSRLPNVQKLLKAGRKYLNPIEHAAAGLGDILLFSFFGEPMHFGIISQEQPRRLMVHAYALVGSVCENGIDQKWQRRIVGAYRYRGVA